MGSSKDYVPYLSVYCSSLHHIHILSYSCYFSSDVLFWSWLKCKLTWSHRLLFKIERFSNHCTSSIFWSWKWYLRLFLFKLQCSSKFSSTYFWNLWIFYPGFSSIFYLIGTARSLSQYPKDYHCDRYVRLSCVQISLAPSSTKWTLIQNRNVLLNARYSFVSSTPCGQMFASIPSSSLKDLHFEMPIQIFGIFQSLSKAFSNTSLPQRTRVGTFSNIVFSTYPPFFKLSKWRAPYFVLQHCLEYFKMYNVEQFKRE